METGPIQSVFCAPRVTPAEWTGAAAGACAAPDAAGGRTRETDRYDPVPRWDEVAQAARERAREAGERGRVAECWTSAPRRSRADAAVPSSSQPFALPLPPVQHERTKVDIEKVYRITVPISRGSVLDVLV